MSSYRPYNLTPNENWSPEQWHDSTSHEPEHSNRNTWQPIFPHPTPPRNIPHNYRRVVHDPWLPVTERPIPVPHGATSYPYPGQPRRRPSHPPVRVLVHDDDIPRHAPYPRPSQPPFESPPPWFLQNQPQNRDESKLSSDEQKSALNKLKKEIYNPVQTKVARQVSLYFRGLKNNMNNTTNESKKDNDEDGKRCAICLEDFVPKEMVTVTPCSHMFHEDCIVPWVTSHGSCPVCRFAICERMKQSTDSSVRTTEITMPHDLMVERGLISIMRAFDENFELDQIRSILLPRLTRG
ncbi:PREDICTED: RING finger protein 44-like [Nicotiana attenuata]|uniref:E3 ubiquitin-protein ligase sdir1 n=1 Tax=Nicotiana attenuata TaxID=49451 RepID=A0A1J6JNC4_NICAT|nr:PREDICTED: RING finger protein 44-like [Nicotiana attenuata]OIT19301.1 e3 ubiquitin-protein ligase sdir1 [Nicotiana attenuata]